MYNCSTLGLAEEWSLFWGSMPSNKEDNSKNKGCTLINGLIEKKISVLGCMNINLLYDIILLKD
jgi:hypothetical protein